MSEDENSAKKKRVKRKAEIDLRAVRSFSQPGSPNSKVHNATKSFNTNKSNKSISDYEVIKPDRKWTIINVFYDWLEKHRNDSII